MRSSEYREILRRLGVTHVGAGCIFGINHRTSRKYALGERRVPRAVAIVLQLMLDLAIGEEEIRAVAAAPVVSSAVVTVVPSYVMQTNLARNLTTAQSSSRFGRGRTKDPSLTKS